MTSAPTQVIYLGGIGRSGSTLLERLLGEVPGVVPLGEVVHLWSRGAGDGEPCGCGVRFPECPFWREVGDRAFGGWSRQLTDRVITLRHRVDRTRRIPPRRSADLLEYGAAYQRLYAAAGDVAQCPIVIDSSKHASLAFCLVAAGMEILVVQVVRDPRGVAHSWRKHVVRPETGTPMTRWGPARTSLHWAAQNLALEFLAARGVRVIRVRYEDLLDSPRRTLARLLIRLHLAPRLEFVTGHQARLGVAHTSSGNPMRFMAGTVDLTLDESWRAAMPRGDRWLVTALTWPLLLRYGYRLRSRPPTCGTREAVA
ncbi:sulfotransferase family protein [Microtetraspora sp. NBRC 13810]|uniref:sulfotransferase n=1 Tax=Microtetraspora sp. NBRC 13810 TaxID=3030990 RepID=UPI0024A3DBBF|nr:sulfotransferase [Microtetraspora sp. NBRC 13810]GLW07293.1 sulfotransferase family protein [Microtetraspora sp. NBRC 13810]